MTVPDFGAYNRARRDKEDLDRIVTIGDVVYHGTVGHDATGRPRKDRIQVSVETPTGQVIRPLADHGKHGTPYGFGWGYVGAGPAALARALLIDALGDAAKCPACAGTRWVVWPSPDAQVTRPYDPAADGDPEHDDLASKCHCDDGHRHLPYQDFKAAVVARWPQGGEWRITRREVLAWLREHGWGAPVGRRRHR